MTNTTADQLVLYVDRHFASPYAMSVHVALQEKALDFSHAVVDLDRQEHHLSSYAGTSLTRRVPTLVHGRFSLSESSAITEYLDEVFSGSPLYPKQAAARARARQVQAWLRSDLMAIRTERTTAVVFYKPVSAPLSAEAQAAADKLFSVADKLLADADSHVAGTWSIADVDLALMLNRLVLNGDAVPEKLAAYARRQWNRPSVKGWVDWPRPAL